MKHETGERNKYIKAKGTIKHQRFTKDRKCYAEHSNTRPSILATSHVTPHKTRTVLGHFGIGDAGDERLADALKSNKTLTKLNLRDSRIWEAGAERLADALKSN